MPELPDGLYFCRCSNCRESFVSRNKRSFHCGDCNAEASKPVKVALHEAYLGPQKQPASLARLKAIVQQALELINELETP